MVSHLIVTQGWRGAANALQDVFQHRCKLCRRHKGCQGLGCQVAHCHWPSQGKLPHHWCKDGGGQLIRLHLTHNLLTHPF